MLPCRNGGIRFWCTPKDLTGGLKRSCVFRKNIDTIATWSVFLVHRSGSFFNIDFKHFKGSERRRHYLFHIMWNGRELFPPVLAQQKNYYDAE